MSFEQGKDWDQQGDVIRGKGGAVATFRGIQADLNYFAEKVGFEMVKVDGLLGPKTVNAVNKVYQAVIKAQPMLAATLAPPSSPDMIAQLAPMVRGWLSETARNALQVGDLRRYHMGTGKDWNVKDVIAYGAGPVHEDFKGLQTDLNRFAGSLGFGKLEVDGFLGPKTATAVTTVYNAVVSKNPMLGNTLFPVPDSKEEVAEYAQFIRQWIRDTAAKNLLAEA
ncbi:MAG: hypothetical protein H0T79_22445 [Deltaproteobacteria bacterium]|nr:hypothetical protein [Deltaproteobacteria bacterium]